MSDLDAELTNLVDVPEPTDDTDEQTMESPADFRVRWRGRVVEIRVDDLTALDYVQFRTAVGVPLPQAAGEGGLDAVAGLLWRMLRRTDPKIKFTTVARELRMGDILDDREQP